MIQGTDEQVLNIFTWENGYFDSDKLAFPPNCLAPGSKNLFVQDGGSLRVFKGVKDAAKTGGRTMFVVAGGFAALVDDGDAEGIGSIFNYISESLFWIGAGKVNYNGIVLADIDTSAEFTATSSLQLSPKEDVTYKNAYLAGLEQPDAPTVVAAAPTGSVTGLLSGLYSFKIARARSATGGRSVASPTSAVVSFSGQVARLVFPLADSNGQNRWAIFATKAGFGGTGVHYLVKEISESDLSTIDGVPRSYEIEFNDSDLLPVTAYLDDYPPPAGAFGARLENYVVVVGVYDNAIAISIRNFPESFNPEHLAFLPARPTDVLPDQQGNYLYISTESGVYALAVAPAAVDNPMTLQTVWSDTGVAYPHNWCTYEGVIFAFTARQGLVTMDAMGKPSSQFAVPISRATRHWGPIETRVFACPDLKSIIVTNNGEAYAFNVQNLKWSPAAVISEYADGEVVSGVIQNRRLQITLLEDGEFNLYEFDEPESGTVTVFIAKSPDVELNPAGRVNVLGLKARFYASETGTTNIHLYTDYSLTPAKTLAHPSQKGMQTTRKTRWYQPRKETVAIAIEGEQSDFGEEAYPSAVTLFGTIEESNRL